ncbi:MAG TPA: metalloregulator ArsR/SmtB family transcription factor [Kofleriaceae bacterium]|nr:metalloregulator ArsR/SmtB family transcription factor [Kofleriaceae bacterium]
MSPAPTTTSAGPARAGGARPIDATFAALADPVRRGVVELLRRGPRRAGELADALDVTAPAMSRHLKVLRTQGLVARALDDDDARATIYRLRPERFTELRAWLEQVERFWTLQLDAFAHHAERRASRAVARAHGRGRPRR